MRPLCGSCLNPWSIPVKIRNCGWRSSWVSMRSDWEAQLLDVHRLWTVHHLISLYLNSLLGPVQAVARTVFLSATWSFSFFVFLRCQLIATCASFVPLVVGDVPHHFLSDPLMCFIIQGPAEASAHLLPTPTNKEHSQHFFSSWSLSSSWLHFLLSLLGRDFLEDLCTLISESKTACFTRQVQYKIAKKNTLS